MPKESPTRLIQRHFAPLTSRSTFRPEIKSKNPLHSSRVVYPLEDKTKGLITPTGLIPKPPGEVARIKRNGYNLQKVLCAIGWTVKEYTNVQKSMRELAKEHLNMGEILTKQDEKSVQKVHKLVKKLYPDLLESFENDWAIDDFLGVILKNSSGRTKKPKKTKNPASSTGGGKEPEDSSEESEAERD